MTTELGNLSSAIGASLQPSDKSGPRAAPLLSGSVEKTGTAPQGEQESKSATRAVTESQVEIEKQVQNLQEFGQLQGWTVNFSVEQELDQVYDRRQPAAHAAVRSGGADIDRQSQFHRSIQPSLRPIRTIRLRFRPCSC